VPPASVPAGDTGGNNAAVPGFIASGLGHHATKGRIHVNSKILCGGIAAIAMLTASSAFAQEMKMKADLSGTQEVPPVTTQGKGSAEISFDAASKKLSWTVTYSGLSGPATAAHFHGPAEPGKNAGVAVPIPNQATSPVTGSATLTEAQAADLTGGRYYVNIHTAANPGGELRGQVTK
jgi:CHRD domain